MSPIEFSLQVILISTSGVLSPGPLFFINLLYASRYGSFVGLKIASGHAMVEFPFIIAISYGLYSFSYTLQLSDVIFKLIGLIGGIFLLFFAILQVLSILKDKSNNSQEMMTNLQLNIKNPILVGFIFTILNPFFLIWWLTVGTKLISDSIINFGIVEGLSIIFLSHIWMDYFWLWFTSFMINRGKFVIKEKFYKIFIIAISVFLGIYGSYLLFMSFTIYLQ
jgi:threonine/homoserine/homoserine lactone efflux protein